jgi:hypothetical protein
VQPVLDAGIAATLAGPDRPLKMQEVAGVIGRFRDVEMVLFSWLGRTAPKLAVAGEVTWASGASLAAAWRASQLEQLLPVSDGLRSVRAVPSLETPLRAGLETLVSFVPSGGPEEVPELVGQWYAVLLEGYSYRLGRRSPAADGPLGRIFERLVADLEVEKGRCGAFGNVLVGTLDSTVTLSPGQDSSAGSRAFPGERA